jgi:hypothetical protein
MSSNKENFKGIIGKILVNLASFLRDTADEMYKFSNSLTKAVENIKSSESSLLVEPLKGDLINNIEQLVSLIQPPVSESEELISLPIEEIDSSSAQPLDSGLLKALNPPKTTVLRPEPSFEIKSELPQERESLDLIRSRVPEILNSLKKVMEKEDEEGMTPDQKRKALKDMEEAIEILNKMMI